MARGLFEQFKKWAGIDTPENPPLKKMGKIRPFEPGWLPASEMKQFTVDINRLVDQYNNTNDILVKKGILKDIQDKIRQVEYKFPANYFAMSPEFRKVTAALYQEIQYQFASLGMHSLLDSKTDPVPVAEVIANMSSQKADRLLEVLITFRGASLTRELGRIYEGEDSLEAQRFQKFLKTHKIQFLGGGNSTNFKISDQNGHSWVLKVDNRLDMPRNVEAHLRGELGELFTGILAERQVSCVSGSNYITRTIQVGEFCSGGDVLEHRRSNEFTLGLLINTGLLFEQMAEGLLGVQEAGCYFPDAKITNWLVQDGKVRIADTKSFLFADGSGKFYGGIPGNEYCGYLQTDEFSPPEQGKTRALDVDKVHAYILGLNLYSYLSGRLGQGKDASGFNFNGTAFQTALGQEYKTLIQALVKPNPADRMSVKDAHMALFKINNLAFKEVFEELKALKVGDHDKVMDDYIRNKQRQINAASSHEQKMTILKELQGTVSDLKKDEATREIRIIIADFRNKAGFFSIGMNAKADRIEHAMARTSIEDRRALLKSESSSDVLQALASHRHFGKSGDVYLNDKGKIDTSQAAQSFKDFKSKFANQIKEQDDDNQLSPGVRMS